MAFTCGINNPDGSQCLHVSRREALGCITRGRVIDSLNQANKERYSALEYVKKANTIASEQADKIVKLETAAKEWEAKKIEATAALKAQNDLVNKLETDLKDLNTTLEGVRAERDAFIAEKAAATT